MNQYLNISQEVAEALAENKPVVALESTIISHGTLARQKKGIFSERMSTLYCDYDQIYIFRLLSILLVIFLNKLF